MNMQRALFCLLLFCACLRTSAFLLDALDARDDRAAYLAAARKLLEEGRELAELLAVTPEPAKYKRRLDALLETRSRMPAAPNAIDPDGVIGYLLRELSLQFAAAQTFVAEGSAANCKRAADRQRKRIELIERALKRAEKLKPKP